ncbi:hypothetical protein GCM10023197_10340 [Gordonia humi]|uniref:SRPBCC domain-containing protein n=1 Tax=Gordonia humi TaxID=686429 RepID=UPI00338C2C57
MDDSVVVTAPADRVWNVITDFAAYHEWNPFQRECSAELTPGAPIRMLVALGPGGPMRQTEYIDEVDVAGRWFTYRMRPAPMRLLHSVRRQSVVDLGDGRSRYESHFEINGPLSPLVDALLGRRLTAKFAAVAAAVKVRAEADGR